MSSTQLVVTLLGLAAVGWVNWYFFIAGHSAAVAAVAGASGVQAVRIEVKGGYAPAVIRVRAGSPVRLDFHRDETGSCSEEIVIPDFGIRTYLPAHRTTRVSFTPGAGIYEFTCGMGMLRGTIIAEPGA